MFKLANHNTSFLTEVGAGLTTFFSMVYVLAANPAILKDSGMPADSLFTATAISVIAATLIMALVANLPFAVAPGMGLNAFFVVMVTQMGLSWQQALTGVLVSGTLFVILSISPLREKVLKDVPQCLQYGVCGGIGLMIAYIGLLKSKVISFPINTQLISDPSDISALLENLSPSLGDLTQGPALLAIIGLLLLGLLLALKVRFSVLLVIIVTTLIGIPLGVTNTSLLNGSFVSLPPDPTPILYKFDFSILTSIDFWSLVVALLFMEVVDGLAGFLGLFGVMGADGDRYRPKMGKAFVADSMGVVVGSFFGMSPNTTYAESGAGVAVGGRTGLTALVTGLFFFFGLFISPLFLTVPFSAIAPTLIFVGFLMFASILKISFKDYSESFPAYAVVLLIALTWRISDSLAIGWLLYILMKVISGQSRKLTITVLAVGLIFALKMFF
ncbi:MAG: NCS2 family permease [Deltaproteobacteria bacterium]|nr:NCS2 family permease [Deltaproteobacteria bacterium]